MEVAEANVKAYDAQLAAQGKEYCFAADCRSAWLLQGFCTSGAGQHKERTED